MKLLNRRVGMQRLREFRRINGYRQLCVWVPDEEVETIQKKAAEAVQSCDRPFYQQGDHDA